MNTEIVQQDMGPLKRYEHLIKLRNARVELGIPLSYGDGPNHIPRSVNKERIVKNNTKHARAYKRGDLATFEGKVIQAL
jgi:hypothetical protein